MGPTAELAAAKPFLVLSGAEKVCRSEPKLGALQTTLRGPIDSGGYRVRCMYGEGLGARHGGENFLAIVGGVHGECRAQSYNGGLRLLCPSGVQGHSP